MSGWPPKPQARIAGVDDGPYRRDSLSTPIIITVMRLDGYIEGFLRTTVTTDGDDSSDRISESLRNSRFADQVRAVLSDGACLAGFNVLDLEKLGGRLGIPVITCSNETPSNVSIRNALEGNFKDWKRRFDLISRWKPERIELDDGSCYIRYEGCSNEEAEWITRKVTIRGRVPEPLRISHMIAGLMKEDGEVDG